MGRLIYSLSLARILTYKTIPIFIMPSFVKSFNLEKAFATAEKCTWLETKRPLGKSQVQIAKFVSLIKLR